MNKKEIQKRVLQDGKPLALKKFTWDAKTKTFSSAEDNLVLDFNDISDCTFKTGYNCTFNTGYNCTFNTYSNCTFKTGWNCTFNTEGKCVLLLFGSIIPIGTEEIRVVDKEWFTKNGDYYKHHIEEGNFLIADNIASKVITTRKNVWKVVVWGEDVESYVVTNGENYAHGSSIKEAKTDLIYKISSRDASKYEDFTVSTIVSLEEGIRMYRIITGACESQTKSFVEGLDKKAEYTVSEIIELTKNQYNNEILAKFIKG